MFKSIFGHSFLKNILQSMSADIFLPKMLTMVPYNNKLDLEYLHISRKNVENRCIHEICIYTKKSCSLQPPIKRNYDHVVLIFKFIR